MLEGVKKIHFIGIAGIGMSGLAQVLEAMGYKVSGSDLKKNGLTKRMASSGARISKGHRRTNLPDDTDVVVYSSAIDKDNPEMAKARERNVRIAHRAELLAWLLNAKKGIAVTGTHGKTTTTSLIAVMLENCGLDPTAIIGGEVKEFRGNAKAGKGRYLVAEADESDGSFLKYRPYYSVITNIEPEHLDYYNNINSLVSACRAFINNTKRGGAVFYNHEDRNIGKALKGYGGRKENFGFSEKAGIHPVNIRLRGLGSSFECVYKKRKLGTVNLSIPGRHNILNALAAIEVGLNLGLDFKNITDSIRAFAGAKRRFEVRARSGGAVLIDDYGHHPTEIRAVLDACRNLRPERVVVIFQPHRYTRTLHLADEFGKCFKLADKLILADIYAASERPIKGVSSKTILASAVRHGMKDVEIMDKDAIPEYVMKIKRSGDAVIVLGAGDISETADKLSESFSGEKKIISEADVAKLSGQVLGKIRFMERLSMHTSFRIGGPADIWIEPADVNELKKILAFAKDKRIKVFVIGRGTNVLARDEGFRGIMIHLGSPEFKRLAVNPALPKDENANRRKSWVKGVRLKVGAGFSMPELVNLCCYRGLAGLESLVGIPGTVGGAIFMNAGGASNPIFKNFGDFITSVKAMDYNGRIRRLAKKDLKFGYRKSNLAKWIILEVELSLGRESSASLSSRASKFLKMKKAKQVLDSLSAGCVFKNPKDSQFTSGQMIDSLGLKGKSMGGAEVSNRHANFIVNRKGATCADVMGLIRLIRKRVEDNYKVKLELEVSVI